MYKWLNIIFCLNVQAKITTKLNLKLLFLRNCNQYILTKISLIVLEMISETDRFYAKCTIFHEMVKCCTFR